MKVNDVNAQAGGRAHGEEIAFALGPSSLGQVLVAHSAHGICALFIGDDGSALEDELASCFAHARLQRGRAGWETTFAAALAAVEDPAHCTDLPIDMRGTALQQRVWAALQRIAPGCTQSYRELAAHIGAAQATRAVGNACAANRIAVLVPCHRAVRSDGGLASYRWGVARKRELLRREREAGAAANTA